MELQQSTAPAARKAGDKALVLVVDDDRSHRKLLELLADRLHITVFLTASCKEALKALEQFSFDVILMDCRMPEVDGYVCTQKIRALQSASKAIPIIAITAQTSEADRQRCLMSGMDDYLAKPFTLEQLHQKLCLWLHRSHVSVATSRQESSPEITLA